MEIVVLGEAIIYFNSTATLFTSNLKMEANQDFLKRYYTSWRLKWLTALKNCSFINSTAHWEAISIFWILNFQDWQIHSFFS